MTKNEVAETARSLAIETAKTATELASKTAETMGVITTDIAWMKKSLSNIEITLDEMRNAYVTAPQHAEVIHTLEDHEVRVRNIEHNMWRLAGATGVITAGITMGLGIALKLFR